jgi:hypothetical protein
MHIWLRICIFIFFLTSSSSLFSQLSFGIPTLSDIQSGDVVLVPVFVYNGFDSIESIQFVVKWDTTVLRYVDVQNFGLPGLSPTNFGFSPDQSNLLRFAYTDPNILQGDGVTVSDTSALFYIKFQVIGATNSASTIVITEEPPTTYFEVIAASGTVYLLGNTTVRTGFVPVGYNLSTQNAHEAIRVLTYPNPVTHTLTLEASVDIIDLPVSIFTQNGQTIWSKHVVAYAHTPYSIDLSQINVSNSLLYLLIHTDHGPVYKPIVFKSE